MITALVRKLQLFVELAPQDIDVLKDLSSGPLRRLRQRDDLVQEGDPPRELSIFLDGWGIRYKSLQDGRRQILGYFIPGDICDMDVVTAPTMDHSIAALTHVTIAEIPREFIARLRTSNPNIIRALELERIATMANFRETILNLGQRSAVERTAHFLCELFVRLKLVDLTNDKSCKIAMTRIDIADATGMTTVHVSRTIQELRAARLLDLEGRNLIVPDLERLKRIALFNPNYLYLRTGSKGAPQAPDPPGPKIDSPETR